MSSLINRVGFRDAASLTNEHRPPRQWRRRPAGGRPRHPRERRRTPGRSG